MTDADFQLVNVDPEEIEELLKKVEKSFNIRFEGMELAHLSTFGELCDHIANKIPLDDVGDCTTQQAFYKLRESMGVALNYRASELMPETELEVAFPRHNRISQIRQLEKHLGLKLDILRSKYVVSGALAIIILVSIVALFINWEIGLLGLVVFSIGLWVASKTGRELDLKTVGQVAEKMSRENYLKSRRNSNTFSKQEIEKVLKDWFSDEFGIETSKLGRDAKLF
ncbi:MAG TPA: hypothetical protein VF602_07185 [Pedobacter sp.]|jgi:hypothetical protein